MGWHKQIGLILVAAFALTAASALSAPVEYRVLTGRSLQTMEGFGAGFNLIADDLMRTIADSDRGRAYDLLFGNPADHTYPANLSIIRLTVSPLAKPRLLNATMVGPRYDWAADPGTLEEWRALQPVFARTNPTLYAVPFTPPPAWRRVIGTDQNGDIFGMDPAHYQDYAAYLADYLWYWKNGLGREISYLSVQNEPGVRALWAYCIWDKQQMHDFLPYLVAAIRARGLATKVISSEGTDWSGAWDHLKPSLDDPHTRGLVDVLASHSYLPADDPARARFADASVQYGKPVWTTEMSLMQPQQNDDPGIDAALKVASYIRKDIVEARASAWIYCFAIFWTIPPHWDHQLGSMGVLSPSDSAPNHALVVPKRYWAMANFSRFVHRGDKAVTIEGGGKNMAAFISADGKRFTVVAINIFGERMNVHISFPQNVVSGVRSYVTSPSADLAPGVVPGAQPGGFDAILAAQSITTFTGTLNP